MTDELKFKASVAGNHMTPLRPDQGLPAPRSGVGRDTGAGCGGSDRGPEPGLTDPAGKADMTTAGHTSITIGPYRPYANGNAVERILYALDRLIDAYDDQYHRDETFAADALDRLAQAADDAMTDGGCDE